MAGRRYKRGMADASRAYQAFGQKQEDALRHILNEVQGGRKDISDALGELDANFDNLYDRLDASEKEKLYSVSMPFDLKTLDEYEKMFLIGALFALAEDCRPTENQQKYILTLKKYLEIPEPPKDPVDPLNIENIDSVEAQKAIYQVVLEYLSLQDEECFDVTDLQTDFLDSFNLSPKIRRAITARVNFLYDVTGTAGLVEKYGFVNQEEIRSKESEELDRIRKAEREKELNKNIVTNCIELLDKKFSKCVETDTFILFLKVRNQKSQYKIINKQNGTIDDIDISFDIANRYSIGRECWYTQGDCIFTVDMDHNICKIDLVNHKHSKLSIRIKYTDDFLAVFSNNIIIKERDQSNHCHLAVYNMVTDERKIIKKDCNPDRVIPFNDGIIIQENNIIEYYNLINEMGVVIFKKEDWSSKFGYVAAYNDSIYIFVTSDIEYGFAKYTLHKAKDSNDGFTSEIIDDGLVYTSDQGIQSCKKGCFFFSEATESEYKFTPSFNLVYFSFEQEKTVQIADRCGTLEKDKKGLLKKESRFYWCYSVKPFGTHLVWENARFSSLNPTYLYVDVNVPMEITSIDGNVFQTPQERHKC